MPAPFRVEITPSAERDITEIWDYISQDSPGNAGVFITRLTEQI